MAAGRTSWRTSVQVYGGIALGVMLLGYFLYSADLGELATIIREVKLGWVGIAIAAMLAHYVLHGLRWKVLLHHVEPDLDWRTVWRATTILWAFNTLLPLRAGNLLRPAVVAMSHDVPYTTLLFTLVAETVCDVFGIVVLVLVMLQVIPASLESAGALAQIRQVGTWTAIAALIGLVFVVLLSTRGARSGMETLVSPIPSSHVRDRILLLFDQLVEGMAAVGSPKQMLQALLVTALVWMSWLLGILATLWAFGLQVPITAAMFIEAALNLATIVPQAPGFLGMFQVVTEKALILFGAPASESKAVALVLWFVCFVPITALGVIDAWRMGISISPSARRKTFTQLSGATDERVHPPQ